MCVCARVCLCVCASVRPCVRASVRACVGGRGRRAGAEAGEKREGGASGWVGGCEHAFALPAICFLKPARRPAARLSRAGAGPCARIRGAAAARIRVVSACVHACWAHEIALRRSLMFMCARCALPCDGARRTRASTKMRAQEAAAQAAAGRPHGSHSLPGCLPVAAEQRPCRFGAAVWSLSGSSGL